MKIGVRLRIVSQALLAASRRFTEKGQDEDVIRASREYARLRAALFFSVLSLLLLVTAIAVIIGQVRRHAPAQEIATPAALAILAATILAFRPFHRKKPRSRPGRHRGSDG